MTAPMVRLQQLLTCSKENVHVESWHTAGGEPSGAWSIEKRTLRGGRQEGVDLIHVENGALSFTVSPTRGMSLLEVVHDDRRFGWHSPVEEVVHPSTIDLSNRGGLGWLEGFNEWIVRCGLEWAGAPGRDEVVTNTGARAEMDLSLHGRIANLPASRVEVVVIEGHPPRIEIRGIVHERLFYGPRLELQTVLSTAVGSDVLRIEDRVVNRAGREQEYQLIYHVNYGPPLLEEGTRFLAPLRRVTPMNDHAAKAVDRYPLYESPTPGFVEEVFCLEPLAAPDGTLPTLLANAAGDLGVLMRQRIDQLPCLTLWKSTGAEADGYVTGIEPGTSYPRNRRIERQHRRVPVLAPGESRDHRLELQFLSSSEKVQRGLEEIAGVQGDHVIEFDRQPREG